MPVNIANRKAGEYGARDSIGGEKCAIDFRKIIRFYETVLVDEQEGEEDCAPRIHNAEFSVVERVPGTGCRDQMKKR